MDPGADLEDGRERRLTLAGLDIGTMQRVATHVGISTLSTISFHSLSSWATSCCCS